MSQNEIRSKKNERQNKVKKQTGNIFYWIIGSLTAVLLLLIVFVFIQSNQKQKLTETEADSLLVADQIDENDEKHEDSDGKDVESEKVDDKEDDEIKEEDVQDSDNTEEDSIQPGESEVVNGNSPHDSNHVVNYNEGSEDRIAIKNKVITATGLDNNLIEWWVGNNGPGKVETTVSDPNKKEIYKVYLQYGDGDWNVTSYERLNEIP